MDKWRLQELKDAKSIFEHYLLNLKEEQADLLVEGEWTIRMIVAHLIEWDKVTLDTIRALKNGRTPRWITDEDAFNRKAIKKWEDKGFDALVSEFIKLTLEVLFAYEELLPIYRDIPLVPGERFTIREQVDIDVEHHLQHLAQIVRTMKPNS